MNLEYTVIYSSRKKITIIVERDRSVIVRAPSGTPREKIHAAVESKKLWLYEKTRHKQKYNASSEDKKFASGTTILYLGKSYTLSTTKERIDGIKFDGKFLVTRTSLSAVSELLAEWYIKRAKEKIIPKVEFYARNLGVEYNRVLISNLKYRWGSCTPKNNLNFNWRLIKAPMSVIVYIIVHELAHIIEPNHTEKFWNIIRTQLPNYQKAKEWLKLNGELLDID
jgi:predicted metal-dependent hydrolase